MTTDFENELRDLFREKAGEAPLATPSLPASAPRQVLRRSRLHQVGTVLGSAAVVVALIVGSVAGLTRILGEGEDRVGSDDYEVFQRTATIEAFTLGSPSDWFLVNEWPMSMVVAVQSSAGTGSACLVVPGDPNRECANPPGDETVSPIPVPHGLPMLQLSNTDLGLTANACQRGLPPDTAVLYVALDHERMIADDGAALPPFPPGESGLPPATEDGPCGRGSYAFFTVNGYPMFAWVGVGTDVSDEDRETVETSYEMMSAIPDWELSPPDETTPAYVIAGGLTQAGDDWRLELRPSQRNVAFSLAGIARSSDYVIPPSVIEWAATDPIFGAISKEAATVEFRGQNDPTIAIPGTIVPLPPSMPFAFDLFFIEDTAGIDGEAVALGPDGEPLEGSTSVGTVREDVVRLDGTLLAHEWRARFRGDFEDGTACIDVTIDGTMDPTGPSCRLRPATSWAGTQPSLDAWVFEEMYVGAGSVPPDVDGVRFRSDDPARTAILGTCATGPTGWTDHDVCAIALPPEDSGTFEYLDADGVVIFDEAGSWGFADPSPSPPLPVDPLHGQSYWAVYPWVGAAGTPEADEVVARLFDDFGIQAIQGEVGCDEGAAEAIGPDAAWRVGVYFATGADASAFADEYRSRNPGSDPVMAHVTTYCLD